MSTAGGPKLKGIGRSSNNLPLCLDCTVGASYAGDPTTNASYDSSIGGYTTLSQTYDWNNSGTSSRTNNPAGILKPPGYAATTVAVCEKKCLTTGSQHMGMGYCDSGISGSTVYTVSLWYRQNRTGVGGPYVRQKVNNNNLGGMEWVGHDGTQAITGTSNWPANEWILLKKTVTTSSNETGLFISNYIGSAVGDTIWCFGPQIEAKSYFTPLVLDASENAAALTRSATDAWRDLSKYVNDGDLTNDTATGVSSYKDGYIINNVSRISKSNSFNYLDFDGTDDKVTINNSTSLQSAFQSSTFTVECVFKADSSQDNPYPRIHQKGNALIHLTQTSPFGIYHNMYDNSSNLTQAGAGSFVSAGQWVHVTTVWEGDASSNRNRIYKNGELFTQATGSASGNGQTSTGHLYLGGASDGSRDLNGQIAFFRVYRKVLTAAEIKSNFNQLRSRFSL
jgi:hypothetical protein